MRYTALATGILYGFVHNRTVQKQHAEQQAHHKQHHQEELLAKAKEAWKQKQAASATADDSQYFLCSVYVNYIEGSYSRDGPGRPAIRPREGHRQVRDVVVNLPYPTLAP